MTDIFNRLVVTGDPTEINNLCKAVHVRSSKTGDEYSSEFSLESVVRTPSRCLSRDGHKRVIWRLKNWGTERDVRDTELTLLGQRMVMFRFYTDDAPILAIIVLAKMFPELSFRYCHDDGSSFSWSEFQLKKGKLALVRYAENLSESDWDNIDEAFEIKAKGLDIRKVMESVQSDLADHIAFLKENSSE